MTNEELQRMMEFIIQQQAQFSANMQMLSESQVKADGRITKLEEAQLKADERMTRMENVVVNLANLTERRIEELVAAQKELATAQKETDERLNILINTVERYLSGRKNGESQN